MIALLNGYYKQLGMFSIILLISVLLFSGQTIYSKLVDYRLESLSNTYKFATLFAKAYHSETQPEIIYFQQSSFYLFKFNQTSGDRNLVIGCDNGNCVDENQITNTGDVVSATRVALTISNFHVESRDETIHIATKSQIYRYQNGNLTLLSKPLNGGQVGGSISEGSLLSNVLFTRISSISRDSIGNLYISDVNMIYKINVNGIINFMSAKSLEYFIIKNDGFANETIFSTQVSNLQHYKGYLYGNDIYSIFKINLETWWMTVIQGRTFNGNQNEGNALNAQIHYLSGFSISKDGNSIYLSDSGKLRVIDQSSGSISTLLQFDSSYPGATVIFSPNFLYTGLMIVKIDYSSTLNVTLSPILTMYGAISDGTNIRNRVFESISAIAYNETSKELLIADSKFGFNLKKLDLKSGIVSTISLMDKFSNVSCWNSSDITTSDNIFSHEFIPNSLQIFNSDLYVSSTRMIQKLDLSSRKGCFYAGTITGDRLQKSGPSSSIILKNPNGISCYNSDIYIADTNNHRILKYTSNDFVQVIAGTGVAGFSGDFGLATNAQLQKPHSVHYDPESGNIYIADSGNNRIRMIFPNNGTIITIIGSGNDDFNGDGLNPLETNLNFPKYVFYDSKTLYISDTNNHRIRTLFNGTISTILGNGITGSKIVSNNPKESQLNSPFGIFVMDYKLFVADTYNHRILRVNLDYNSVEIIAGTGEPGYNGDGMIATQSKLFQPSMISTNRNLNPPTIYISDTFNNKIRLLYNGVLSSISNEITSPIGICDFTSNIGRHIVIYTNGDNSISSSFGPLIKGIADGPNVFHANVNPSRILLSKDATKMIISESDSNRIRMVDNIKGDIKTIAGTGQLGFSGDDSSAVSAKLASPKGLVQGVDSDLIYFADSNNHRIRVIIGALLNQTSTSLDPSIMTAAGTGEQSNILDNTPIDPLKAKLNTPTLVSTLRNGNLIIGDTFNRRIEMISKIDRYDKFRTITDITDYPVESTIITDIAVTEENVILFSTQNSIHKLIPQCEKGYQLVNDNTECAPICFGLIGEFACSGRGDCILPNQCSCDQGFYTGIQCEIPICYGIAANDSKVCSFSNGTCEMNNQCKCNDGFYGANCEFPTCFSQIMEESCGIQDKRGKCINKDKCLCNEHFAGDKCQFSVCSGITENNVICSGHGKCIENGICQCHALYSGADCSEMDQIYALSISAAIVVLIVIVLLIVSTILGLTVYRKNRKERRILETELSLDERLLSTNDNQYELSNHSIDSTIHSSSSTSMDDPSSFIIPLHKIGMDKPIKRLGEGGMGSVFMSKYNGMIVAVKVFDLNNLNISEEDFKNEAIVLSKLRHPNIINFYGVSTSPTKRYIIMECLDQSMEKVIAKLEFKQLSLSLQQKLKMILNIANGIEYLHNLKPRKIIHRDLKPQNILLDSNGNCKLCDFGLSKSISQATVSAITSQLGTHYYMSPEMFDVNQVNPNYATFIDIYSFSIIMWQLLFEIKDPYLFKSLEISQKLRTNSLDHHVTSYQLTKMICENNYRPAIPFNNLEECENWCFEFMKSELNYSATIFNLCELIRKCWNSDPKQRPNIEQVLDQLQSFMDNIEQ